MSTQVGPVLRLGVLHPQRERAQRVVLAAAVVLVLGQRVGRLAGRGHAAGGERDLQLVLLGIGAELRRRELVVRAAARPSRRRARRRTRSARPASGPPRARARSGGPPRRRSSARSPSTRDLARGVGLHPDDRAGLAHVAQQGSEDQFGHGGWVPAAPEHKRAARRPPAWQSILGLARTWRWNTVERRGVAFCAAWTSRSGSARSAASCTRRSRRASRNPVKAMDAKAMEMASRDAELRAALFRLVDVTPATRSLDDLARHLGAYLERGGRPAAADRGGDEGVGIAGRAPGARRGRGGRRAPHGAPLHRRRVAEGRAEGAARAVGRRRGDVGRPARRGHRDQRGGRPLRRALPGGAGDAGGGRAEVARAPGAGGGLARARSRA